MGNSSRSSQYSQYSNTNTNRPIAQYTHIPIYPYIHISTYPHNQIPTPIYPFAGPKLPPTAEMPNCLSCPISRWHYVWTPGKMLSAEGRGGGVVAHFVDSCVSCIWRTDPRGVEKYITKKKKKKVHLPTTTTLSPKKRPQLIMLSAFVVCLRLPYPNVSTSKRIETNSTITMGNIPFESIIID